MSAGEKQVFEKAYSRDFGLVLEHLWIEGLTRENKETFSAENPYYPVVALYVTGENLEIWENEAAIKWYTDRVLEKNKGGTEFIQGVIAEYSGLMEKLEAQWAEGPLAEKDRLTEYLETVRRAVLLFSLWYYSCIDERTPDNVRVLVDAVREKDEFFARNNIYLKDCIVALGGERSLANLVLPGEFPEIPSNSVLGGRMTGVVITGSETVFSSLEAFADAHPQYEFIDLEHVPTAASEVHGSVGNKGVVQGRVRIVKNERNCAEVQAGEILVSPMTTPDFIAAMKIAAAYVTDEGGIMCHAAIIARELKKPCVIGTKIATKVLHDGDMVEVDADKGAVRILERKEK